MCNMHYLRWRSYGDPTFTKKAARPMVAGVCAIDGCGRRIEGNGYCRKHNQRYLKWGDPHKRYHRREKGACKVDGCDGREREDGSAGYCAKHYSRWLRHGDPLLVRGERLTPAMEAERKAEREAKPPRRLCRNVGKTCSVDGCGRQATAKGMCNVHYQRQRRRAKAKLKIRSSWREIADRKIAEWREG